MKLLYTCLVICLLSYKSFISCSILLINSFEIRAKAIGSVLIFNLDKRIGESTFPFPV